MWAIFYRSLFQFTATHTGAIKSIAPKITTVPALTPYHITLGTSLKLNASAACAPNIS